LLIPVGSDKLIPMTGLIGIGKGLDDAREGILNVLRKVGPFLLARREFQGRPNKQSPIENPHQIHTTTISAMYKAPPTALLIKAGNASAPACVSLR
jgi:hypothetical protein